GFLLMDSGADVNACSSRTAPLIAACDNLNVALVRKLIQKKVRVEMYFESLGRDALSKMCYSHIKDNDKKSRQTIIVKLLIEQLKKTNNEDRLVAKDWY